MHGNDMDASGFSCGFQTDCTTTKLQPSQRRFNSYNITYILEGARVAKIYWVFH
jgi:hypothetical protein